MFRCLGILSHVLLCLVGIDVALGADRVTTDQQAQLKMFRTELVAMTPGKGHFPNEVRVPRTLALPEEPQDQSSQDLLVVAMPHAYEIAKYEVTQDLWVAVMGTNPSRWKGGRNSVEMISYDEAVMFCERISGLLRSKELIKPNEVIRLPTELEWEYAARGGTQTAYSYGDDPKELGNYGWSTENAAGNDPPVGAKKPNPWGLYDVHGYLWEWCTEVKSLRTSGERESETLDGTNARQHAEPTCVLRGGSWKDPASRLTSASRRPALRTLKDDAVGFRCVLVEVDLEENGRQSSDSSR